MDKESDYIVNNRENTKDFVRSIQNMSEKEFQEVKLELPDKIMPDGSFEQQMEYMRKIMGLKPRQTFADLEIPDEKD